MLILYISFFHPWVILCQSEVHMTKRSVIESSVHYTVELFNKFVYFMMLVMLAKVCVASKLNWVSYAMCSACATLRVMEIKMINLILCSLECVITNFLSNIIWKLCRRLSAWLLLSLLLLIGRIFVYNVLLCKVKKRTRIGLIERKREAYASWLSKPHSFNKK